MLKYYLNCIAIEIAFITIEITKIKRSRAGIAIKIAQFFAIKMSVLIAEA